MYPWFGLHVRCHDLHVIVKITTEGVTLPVAFGFDNFKGNSSQEVLKGGTDELLTLSIGLEQA